ncbi:MAG: response regulator [Acidobacteria bacterium]|nr:MAG: response regulator [Acidobacteriota bacterium]
MKEAKILVVEDEALVALHLEQRLQMLGHSVVGTAFSGTDALEQTAAHLPDLVLMDINLGRGISGIEAAQQINRILDIPVVFVTAHSDDAILQKATAAGPYGYVLKPFEDSALRVTIEIALSKHQLDQERTRILEELGASIARVKTLRGLLPICSRCHKIRDDEGYWKRVEVYIQQHTDATCKHGICPDCLLNLYEFSEEARSRRMNGS